VAVRQCGSAAMWQSVTVAVHAAACSSVVVRQCAAV
jgi:hypothetical protein